MDLLKKPSAWVPLMLSGAIVCMLLITLLTVGVVRHEDEGVEAHLFQLWLVIEAVLISFFALKWLPRAPHEAIIVLSIQIAVVAVACAPVWYFNL